MQNQPGQYWDSQSLLSTVKQVAASTIWALLSREFPSYKAMLQLITFC